MIYEGSAHEHYMRTWDLHESQASKLLRGETYEMFVQSMEDDPEFKKRWMYDVEGRWEYTGLLEGIEFHNRYYMACVFEIAANYIVDEIKSTPKSIQMTNYLFPLLRRIYYDKFQDNVNLYEIKNDIIRLYNILNENFVELENINGVGDIELAFILNIIDKYNNK